MTKPATKSATRESLIGVGLKLIQSGGYTATGINQILDAAKIPKGSFYHHFSTKDEFVMEVIRRYAAGEGERLERLLDDPDTPPLKRLRRYFKDLIATYGRRGGPIAGCLLGNLSLEVAGQSAEIRDLRRRMTSTWHSPTPANSPSISITNSSSFQKSQGSAPSKGVVPRPEQ